MSREVCGVCWTPYDDGYKCACPTPALNIMNCPRCGKRLGGPEHVHTCTPKALRLADEFDTGHQMAHTSQWRIEAAAELRRLHEENERLTKLCYDYIGELTAMRAAKQMQDRIDKMKVAVAPVGLPAGESAAVAAAPARTLTDEVIADLWARNGTFHHHFARAIERWLKGEE